MTGNEYGLLIIVAIATILGSLLAETQSIAHLVRKTWNNPTTTTLSNLEDDITYQHIPLNINSALVSDSPEIWHDPKQQVVCVSLYKDVPNCPHPALLGRLSGPALALLEWDTSISSYHGDFVQCGSYKDQWLEAGTYFLEIIVLFCNDFGVNNRTRTTNEAAWLHYNFAQDCMINPNNHRVTEINASITIQQSTTTPKNTRIQSGRWVSNSTYPLYTRYQPRYCRRNPEQQERCAVPMNDTLHKSYSFQWEHNFGDIWNQQLQVATQEKQIELPKICLVEFSDSQILKKSFEAIGLERYVEHVEARYLSDVNEIESLLDHYYIHQNCTNFVMGFAQLPTSQGVGGPYLLDRFYSDVQRITRAAAITFTNNKDIKVYLRSLHHIPVGDATAACPMKDWRSPVVMDAYTYLLQKAVKEVQNSRTRSSSVVEFMDTRFIASPMWDSAFDWEHLSPQVSDVEALYMASIIYDNIWNGP